jgi:SAM-dependent methyltransferase
MSTSERVLEPEWLDELPPSDRRAQRSRGDLRRINALMGNARLLARSLASRLPAGGPLRIADLGAGDGAVALRVARRLGRRDVEWALVDRSPAAAPALIASFNAYHWNARIVSADVMEFLSSSGPRLDAIVVNLFLHHLAPEALRRLLGVAAEKTRLFVACEPRRSSLALHASRLLWVLGCNDVTRHDAVVSVRAGFAGDELSKSWPAARGWKLHERAALPFSHLFIAEQHGRL